MKNYCLWAALLILFVARVVGSFGIGFVGKPLWQLPENVISKNVSVKGTIVSEISHQSNLAHFKFSVSGFQHQPQHFLLRLSWFNAPKILRVGQRWVFTVRLKPPVGLHDPGIFNYAKWLRAHHIAATGYVVAHAPLTKLKNAPGFYMPRLREAVATFIVSHVKDTHVAAILSALSVGLRNYLQPADWQVFQKTGTSHLVAISGLHIGLVASLIFLLVERLWLLFPGLLLRVPAIRAGQCASMIAAVLYAALSGFALPAVRACIMLTCLLGGELVGKPVSFASRFLMAALFIMLLHPASMFSASAWLSFMAVGVLGFCCCGRLRVKTGWQFWLRIQIALFLMLMPLSLWFFQQVSLVSVLSNAIAIPWVGWVIVPIILLATLLYLCHLFLLSVWCIHLSAWLLVWLWRGLSWVSTWPFSSWHKVLLSPWFCGLAVCGAFMLSAPRGWSARWLGCFGFLPLLCYHPKVPGDGEFWVTVLDVGQGLSVVVQTAKHVLLYDAGPRTPNGFDAGKAVVLPFLAERSIHQINRMVISHGDMDHRGGVPAIMAALSVNHFISSDPQLVAKWHGQYCLSGQHWVWDGVHFSMLAPKQTAPYLDNNSSCVLKISDKSGSMLLAGDIEQSAELSLVRQYGVKLKSTVLLAAHHGSITSSSYPFIQAVLPAYAIISAGAYNRYHFPSNRVMHRFAKVGAKTLITSKKGAINIRFLQHGQVTLASTRF